VEPEALARQARIEQAAEARDRRQRWDRALAEEATLADLLARGGSVAGGQVVAVGADHVVVTSPAGLRYVAFEGVEVVERGDAAASPARTPRTLREELARRAGTGEVVSLRLRSGQVVSGPIDSVGLDVLAFEPSARYVSLSSVVELRAGEGSG
jgi:hypothetical protein